ncbi:hypothetical protein U1Q18_050095 [Sarracenia purpurea var. burkii]
MNPHCEELDSQQMLGQAASTAKQQLDLDSPAISAVIEVESSLLDLDSLAILPNIDSPYLINHTYSRTCLQIWLSEAVSPMKSLAKEDSTRWREESTLRTEWLDPLVKDEEMDASSSPEELELGFGGCHGLLLLLQEEREPVWNSGHQLGVAEELSAHSSAMVAI